MIPLRSIGNESRLCYLLEESSKGANMRLSRALEEKVMDVRLRDKLVAEGKLTKEQVAKYLADIPDETDNSIYTEDVEDQDL